MAREIRYDSEFESADFDEIDDLFRAAGLGGRDPERYREACRCSFACILARDGDCKTGMIRPSDPEKAAQAGYIELLD